MADTKGKGEDKPCRCGTGSYCRKHLCYSYSHGNPNTRPKHAAPGKARRSTPRKMNGYE